MIWSPVVWGEGVTDYYIDSLARFTSPVRVLINLPRAPDRNDPFHQAALDTHDALEAVSLEIEMVTEPDNPRVKTKDFVASYTNYHVCNGVVIAAEFGDKKTDRIAEQVLARNFPGGKSSC